MPGDACPGDCRIGACTLATGSTRVFDVGFTPPAGKQVQGITVSVDYPEGQVSITGSGNDSAVVGSISHLPFGTISQPNDVDWSLIDSLVRSSPFSPGRLFSITFTDCQCATAPAPEDFTCTVTDASDPDGNVLTGATCAVTAP